MLNLKNKKLYIKFSQYYNVYIKYQVSFDFDVLYKYFIIKL